MPFDADAKLQLASLQWRGIRVRIWKPEVVENTTYFACPKEDIEQLLDTISAIEAEGTVENRFCGKRSEYLFSFIPSGSEHATQAGDSGADSREAGTDPPRALSGRMAEPSDSTLPTEADFLNPHSQDLDERHAVKMFLGKTSAQAEAMFRQNSLAYGEDLTYMRAPAFRFYILPAIRYLLSENANGDSDAANILCYALESRLREDPAALNPIAPIVLDAIGMILRDFERFECYPEIYGDIPSRYRAVITQMSV